MRRTKKLVEYLKEGNFEFLEEYIKQDVVLKPLKYIDERLFDEFVDEYDQLISVKVNPDGSVIIKMGMYEGLAQIVDSNVPEKEIVVIKKVMP